MIQNYDHCLRFQVIDKRIAYIDDGTAEVVADNHGNICIHIEFDEQWDDCGKIARFIYNGKWTDVVLDADGDCMCPNEVVKKGRFSLGVYGAELKTTTPIVVTVAASILSESGEELPEDPTPGIYGQILDQYAVTVEAADKASQAAWDAVSETEAAIKALNDAAANSDKLVEAQFNEYAADWNAKMAVVAGRVDEVVAMSGSGGPGTYTFGDDNVECKVVTNGAVANITVATKVGHSLAIFAHGAYLINLPDEWKPLDTKVVLDIHTVAGSDEVMVSIGANNIAIVNNGSHDATNLILEAGGTYHLASLFVPELADVRVGAEGETYDSAGTAVREQIKKVPSNTSGGLEVALTLNEDISTYTADTTASECITAFENGAPVVIFGTYVIDNEQTFYGTMVGYYYNGDGDGVVRFVCSNTAGTDHATVSLVGNLAYVETVRGEFSQLATRADVEKISERLAEVEENGAGGSGGASAEIIDGVLCVTGGKIVAEIENNVLCVR